MADYTIDVGVQVTDTELDNLETRINALKNQEINLKVGIGNGKQLAKNAQTAVQAINKASVKAAKNTPVAKGANLVSQMLDPNEALKQMSSSLRKITKYGQNLDLGEIKLSVNATALTELDNLKSKLTEIKSIAHNMGSIQLTVGDNIRTQNGRIIVGSSSSRSGTQSGTVTVKQAQAEIKKNMRTIGTLQSQYLNGTITEQIYKQSKKNIGQRNSQLARIIQNNGTSTDWVTTSTDLREAQAKNQASYQAMIASADKYGTIISNLQEKQAAFNKTTEVYNKNNVSPLNKTLGKGYEERLNNYSNILKQMEASNQRISQLTGNDRDTEIARFNALYSEAHRQGRHLSNTNQFFTNDTSNSKYRRSEYVGVDLDASSDKVQNKMNSMVSELAQGSRYTSEFNAAQGKLYATIERGSGILEKYQFSYKDGPGTIDQSLVKVSQSVRPLSGYISEIGQKFRNLSQYLVSNFGFQALSTGVRSGVESIRELDSALTELKKTSTGTKKEYSDFTAQAKVDAKAIGSTTTQLTNSAADYSRLGYSLEESQTLAKNTGILKNVSEFESIDDATEAMISMMKAYDVKVDDSMDLVDKMNLIGNNYAISTDGIATALQNSGSALVAAGNDFDKSVALVTAANSVVQDPSQVGAGLRTIALRLRGTSAEELTSMGEDTEGLVETTSKLNANIKALTAVNGKAGVSILDMNGNYRDTYDILRDISAVWDDIEKQDLKDGQNRQAALLEMMAGKNRSNILASILQHPDLLTEVYNDSANNFQNSAQNELNTYLNSIEAKTTKIRESWSQIWQSDESMSAYGHLLDFGDNIINLLGKAGLGSILGMASGIGISRFGNWGGTNYQLILS